MLKLYPAESNLQSVASAKLWKLCHYRWVENAGLDPVDLLVELRTRHEKGEKWASVDVLEGKSKVLETWEFTNLSC
jgi:hypothetical protein